MSSNPESPVRTGAQQEGDIVISRVSLRRASVLAAAVLVGVATTGGVAIAGTGGGQKASTVYSSLPSPLKGNLPSVGFEAYAYTAFGDDATFRSDGGTHLTSVSLGLSSWGCTSGHWYSGDCVTTPGATFDVPMTLTIYTADLTSVVAQSTQTFAIPYRPSASEKCTDGRYWDNAVKDCFNGDAVSVTFPFAGETLPDGVVWKVEYNTSHYGPNPVGDSAACYTSSGGCGYDSLNIALAPETLIGTNPTPDAVYLNSPYGGEYCDGGAAGVGTFRLDSPSAQCWSGYVPAIAFKAAA